MINQIRLFTTLLLAVSFSFAIVSARAQTTPDTVAPLRQAAAAPAALADMTVKDPVTVGYRLGYTLTAPQYSIMALDEQVQSLRTITNPQEVTSTIARIDRLSQSTREYERRSLLEAVAELAALGAPPTAYADASAALGDLNAPLETKATADAAKETDPATVRILATIEEADRVLPKSWTRVLIWLKLSHTPDSVWGFKLGQLAASLKLASFSSPNVAGLGLVDDLRKAHPSTVQKPLTEALDELNKRMRRQSVNMETLADAAKAIAAAYPPPPF